MEQEMEAPEAMEAPEELGRGTDTVMAHLSLGEVVIPRAFLDDPQVMEMLQALFEQNGANLAEFTVGDQANKINPETGYPEFFSLKKLVKGIAKKFTVKSLKSFALPAALSYFAPGLGSALGGSILGAGAAGSSTLGNALLGAGLSGVTGGNPLTGAVTGALGANIGGLGSGAQGATQSGASLGSGNGIIGALGDAVGVTKSTLPSIGSISGSVGGGSSFSPVNSLANALGGFSQDAAIKKQQKALLEANAAQRANYDSFDPSGITEDPGYKFNLQQGQEGLNKGLAAGGSLFSGKALKAASEYNQNYANNAFNNYYQRWLQKVQGTNALTGAAGDVRANAIGAGSQNLAQSLSNALGSPVGQYGQSLTLEQLRRLGMAV